MAFNVSGTVNLCQAFAHAVSGSPYKGERASCGIVNISSGAGLLGVPTRLSYVASKFAVSGITRTMAAGLGPYRIRVNTVAPGMTRTPFTSYMFKNQK